jgi:N-acetylglutamate synthase-like GNAT family acetyltransferase
VSDPRLAPILAFEQGMARRSARRVVELPFGVGLLNDEVPLSWDHNRLLVTEPATAADVGAAAEDVLGGAGVAHRQVSIDVEDQGALAEALKAQGWTRARHVVMALDGAPLRSPDASVRVRPVSLEELREPVAASWRREQPTLSEEGVRQLVDRRAITERAVRATFLGAFAEGRLAARCDLYRSDDGRVAQVEEVNTDPDVRGRGLGTAVVLDAVYRALAGGAELVFLRADADDWPQEWYRDLGFVDVAHLDVASAPERAHG